MKKLIFLSLLALGFASCGTKTFEEKTADYDSVSKITNQRAIVTKDGLYGIVDETGDEILEPSYTFITDFTDGIAAVQSIKALSDISFTHTWGFINDKGEIILAPIMDKVHYFMPSGLAVVKYKSKYGMVNKQGKYVVDPIFKNIGPFENGIAQVQYGGGTGTGLGGGASTALFGVINDKGEMEIPTQFSFIGDFVGGIAPVQYEKWGKYGYMDKNGEPAFDAMFDEALAFEGDVARVKRTHGWNIINRKGETILEKDLWSISPFSNGLASVRISISPWDTKPTAGYMDSKGNMQLKYDWASNFNNGFASVKVRDPYRVPNKISGEYKIYYTLINTNLEPITDMQFDIAYEVQEGLSKVLIKGKGFGFMNGKGEMVIPCQYNEANYREGYIECKLMGRIYNFDYSGKAI